MKKPLRLIALLLALLLHSGCAHLFYSDDALLERIDRQLEQQNYCAALKTLDALGDKRASSAAFRDKRKEVTARQRSYEQATINRAKGYQSEGRWKEAHALYREALPRLPEESPVVGEWEKFRKLEEQEIARLRLSSDLIRARYLIDTIALLSANEGRLDPDNRSEPSLAEYRAEARRLAHGLHQAGDGAMQRGDYPAAVKPLNLALRLNPDDAAIKGSLATLNTRTEVKAQYVEELKRQAASYYGSEAYAQALKSWEEALSYAPNDRELKEKIERVKRVLESLQQIEGRRP